MIEKFKKNKSLMVLLFLAVFSFSYGLFDNYRVLWLDQNGLSTSSISRVITFASVVTALALMFFSLKVSTKKLKYGVLVSLIMMMITSTFLLCLNGSEEYFLIKFLTFFNIAFGKLVFSSVYPLIMNIEKNDEIYTKKSVVDSVADKLGFFLVSFMLGKSIGSIVFDLNTCLLLSIIMNFIAFLVLLKIDVNGKEEKCVTVSESIKYLNKNKILYLYLVVNIFSNATFMSILGLRMLTLTEINGLSTKAASYLVLVCGILTNILSILIVKYFKSKNDYINLFFKFGFRLILFCVTYITNSPLALLITIVGLLLSDATYGFMLGGYFLNHIEEKFVLIYSVFTHITTLLGNGLGTYICGITFDMDVKYIGLAALSIGSIMYIIVNILIYKKRQGVFEVTE